jgi:BON domain-containing protein
MRTPSKVTDSDPLRKPAALTRRRTAHRLALCGALAVLLLVPACREEPPVDPPPPPPPAEAEVELTPDELLAEAVRQAFLQAPALAQQNITIAVVQSQVFLTGDVAAPHLRDEAVAVAGSVSGVKSVESRIRVVR